MSTRKLVIEVTPWPNDGVQDADSCQWDIYVNDNWVAGGTGPDGGDPGWAAADALDFYFERRSDWK